MYCVVMKYDAPRVHSRRGAPEAWPEGNICTPGWLSDRKRTSRNVQISTQRRDGKEKKVQVDVSAPVP